MPAERHKVALIIGVLFGIPMICAQSTEGPGTAPRGALLLEVDVLAVSVDQSTPVNDGVHYRSTTAGALMVSTGLTEQLDIQFGFELCREENTSSPGLKSVASGHGDGWLRVKWNFSGNGEEGPAWALLPYLKLPFAVDVIGNNQVEPGMILIFGQPWGDQSSWQVNAGLDWLDDGSGGRDTAIPASTAFTHGLSDRHTIYYEFLYAIDLAARSDWSGEVGLGWTYTLSDRGWIDVAVYIGLTRAAPDYTPILRFGWHF